MKKESTVKWFSRLKEYGFTQADADGDEIFVRDSAMNNENYSKLDHVEYEETGRSKAKKSNK